MAKVGSKRTPIHPVFCSEVEEGREGSERRLYPQMKEQWPRHEARETLISPKSLWRPGEVQTVARKLKARFDEADREKQCFEPVVELKFEE